MMIGLKVVLSTNITKTHTITPNSSHLQGRRVLLILSSYFKNLTKKYTKNP